MSQETGHWYHTNGEPCHFMPKKDGSGNRQTTLRDARQLNLLPSVTTILKSLAKPQLMDWIIEQNVLAAVTTPRKEGETVDEFVKRIMAQDAKAETDAARDRGTEMHAAMELLFQGRGAEVAPEILPWVQPAYEAINIRRMRHYSATIESVIVGDGYAGKMDLQQIEQDGNLWLWDWKTCKKLPSCAYPEARLQLSAYAQAVFMKGEMQPNQIRTGNVYISTVEQGKFVVCEHTEPWPDTYLRGFLPLLTHWCWATGYKPQQKLETAPKCL